MFIKAKYWAIAILVFYSGIAIAQISDNTTSQNIVDTTSGFGAYNILHIPALQNPAPRRKIVIAVIDDGFSLTHQACKKYYFQNRKEVASNSLDEDGNGFIDDVTGWDVSDNDNKVSIPRGKEEDFYHGTGIAGIIIKVLEKSLGSKAGDYFEILPVKAMADNSQKPYMDHGYEGIDYAVKMNADIICCAWSGGQYDKDKYQSIFSEAVRKRILIIGSAGNFYSEKTDPPASISTVYAVGAIDSTLRKLANSNYGTKIDLVASGENVRTPYPIRDNTYTLASGTSSAAALVTGCAALLKIIDDHASPYEIIGALKNTAIPVDSVNRYYGGKLGAGLPELTLAANYIQAKPGRDIYFNSKRVAGDITIDNSTNRAYWEINPIGGYRGINFQLTGKGRSSANDKFEFYAKDSLYADYTVQNFPATVYVPGGYAKFVYTGKRTASPVSLSYTANPIDSTTLYCSNIEYVQAPEGIVTDGSGTEEYANNCACKWQITVPEGKRVKLVFDEFDTQPNIDFVWMFDGTSTLQENALAQFSGPNLPPVIVSRSNKVLVWFVTDKEVTGKGWHLNYTYTDEMPGVQPPMKK